MSNLTDLLPAGAGGKQVSFVASGAIGNGVTVALKSDGTVVSTTTSTVLGNSALIGLIHAWKKIEYSVGIAKQ
jgi:hypothetical protein